MAGRYSVLEEIPTTGAEADLLLVEDEAGWQWVAKIYRAGIEPKTEVLERLGRAAPEHVIQLREHGRSDGRVWEVLEHAPQGSLRELLRREGPRLDPATVEELLRELSEALAHLHAHAIEHRDLKPDNVLVRVRQPLDLVLIDFGIASVVEASVHFTSGSRTIRYAPPEAVGGTVYKGRWDYWSLGVILVEALTGRHPFEGLSDQIAMSQLATRSVDELAAGVSDPRWRLLCRGLLRREPRNRWGKAEIDRWLRGDSSLSVVEEGAAPTHEAIAQKPYSFAGKVYATPASLAAALALNWNEARKHFERGYIKDWIAKDVRNQDLVSALEDLDRDQSLNRDTRLFKAILRFDPTLPPTYAGVALEVATLRQWASDALKGDPAARANLGSVYGGHLLSFVSDVTGDPAFATIEQQWRAALDDYERLRQQVGQSDPSVQVAAVDDGVRAQLLLASLPDRADFVAHLRQRATQMASATARENAWFRDLGKPASASPSALLLIPILAHDAEAQTADRRRREAEERAAREYQEACRTYGTVAGCVVGLAGGVVVGAIAGAVPGLVVAGVGMVLGVRAGSGWVQTARRDPDIVKAKGIGIAAVAVAIPAIIAFIVWREKEDSKRVASMVDRVVIAQEIRDGKPIGATRTFTNGATPVALYLEYKNAKPGDEMDVRLFSGNRHLGSCAGPLGYCTWARLDEGNYTFQLLINGELIGTYDFSIVDAGKERRRVANMVKEIRLTKNISNRRPRDDVRVFKGGSSPVGFYMDYMDARAGRDTVSLRLFSGGQQISKCDDFVLQYQTGNYWCSWDNIYAGTYEFHIHINNQKVREVDFSVVP